MSIQIASDIIAIMMKKAKHVFQFIKINYRKFLLVLYMFLYFITFHFLEARQVPYFVISTKFDHMIPFCEYFVIPYDLWFFYMTYGIVLTIFQKKGQHFYRMGLMLFIGMNAFLIISFLFPNGQDLRPQVMPRDNAFTHMVLALYRTDTPTNVFPSIHVFNSIAITVALDHLPVIRRHFKARAMHWILMVLIIISTMFIKQHSIIDVFGAITLFLVLYPFIYGSWSHHVEKYLRAFDSKHYDGNYELDWFGQP